MNRAWPGQGGRHQHHLNDIMAIKAYDEVATVPESRVQWRAVFQSGSRVLKKVF